MNDPVDTSTDAVKVVLRNVSAAPTLHAFIRALAAERDAARAEVKRLREAAAWRPIETAPRDGTRVLVYPAWYDAKSNDYRAGEAYWQRMMRKPGRWATGASSLPYEPTHWLPLPQPPAKEPRDADPA